MNTRVATWLRLIAMTAGVVIVTTSMLVAVQSWDSQPAASYQLREPFPLPPPPQGYTTTLLPVGSYASLPADAQAAAAVYVSSWEPRPDNARYNHTMPPHLRLRPVDVRDRAYDPHWNKYILDRITGHFEGSTDEILQWAAIKWGLPDNLLRTIAYMESDWHQSNYGDYVNDRAECPRGFTRLPCPVTFGIVGIKSTSWPGMYPWNRKSTAAAADALGGWLRGCYEGWVWWLRAPGNRPHGVYHAGDIWGCVGAWYSGRWLENSPSAPDGLRYTQRAKYFERTTPWLDPQF